MNELQLVLYHTEKSVAPFLTFFTHVPGTAALHVYYYVGLYFSSRCLVRCSFFFCLGNGIMVGDIHASNSAEAYTNKTQIYQYCRRTISASSALRLLFGKCSRLSYSAPSGVIDLSTQYVTGTFSMYCQAYYIISYVCMRVAFSSCAR